MSTGRQRKAFAGVTKLRKTLRRIEPEAKKRITTAFQRGAEAIHFDAISNAYAQGLVDSGDMVASISIKYGRDGLSAVIGPGADTVKINKSPFNTSLYVRDKAKHEAFQFFKGYWAEYGTKPHSKKGKAGAASGQKATPFMIPAFDINKSWIQKEVGKAINYTLIELTKEGGIDE